MNVALVYDRVNKFGGAEKVLLALHDIWPDAPLFTAVYNPDSASWAKSVTVIPSFLNKFPFAKRHHELYPWLTEMAFESFNFDSYDVVISVTSAEAKSIITKPGTLHICYCLTPTRYLWSGYNTYQEHPGLGEFNSLASTGLRIFKPTLQRWDLIASSRPDYFVAISNSVKNRINAFYKRDVSEVIYPPVNTDIFIPSVTSSPSHFPKNYFLVVSRLVGYKRLDILIDAFNSLQLPLIIIGDGNERQHLQQRAGKTITFIFHKLTDEKLTEYYQQCSAFVYAAEEDFGIVLAEAQSCGRPVIAFAKGGATDIVKDAKTGILFSEQNVESVVQAVQKFQTIAFNSAECRAQVLQFSRRSFQQHMQLFVETAYNQIHTL